MANILLSFYLFRIDKEKENIQNPFYESLANALVAAGNNVHVYNTAHLIEPDVEKKYDRTFVENDIKRFNPDLVIVFNNRKYDRLESIVNCPIIIWNADNLWFYENPDQLKKSQDRYFFFSFFENGLRSYAQYGIDKSKVFVVGPGTSILAEGIPQDKNLSFIATKFYPLPSLTSLIEDPLLGRRIYHLFLRFWSNPIYDRIKFLTANESLDLVDRIGDIEFQYIANIRELPLIHMLDLDIHIYGMFWESYAQALPPLYASVHREPVYSLKQNQDIYNSSKICLNINHPQAGDDGMAWRVLDIMASNGCLVSNFSTEIQAYTKDFVEIPMFKNPWDVRDVCAQLLKDDNRRLDIVAGAQKCIEAKGRWSYRIREIEQIVGVRLINASANPGELTFPGILEHIARREAEEATAAKEHSLIKPKLSGKQWLKWLLQNIFHFFGLEVRRYRGP